LSARFGLSGLRLSACQVSRSEMTLIRVRAPLAFSRAHNCLTTLHIAEMLKSLRSRRAEVLTSQYSPGSRRARRGWQRRRGRPSRSRVSWRRGSSQGPRSPRQARWRRCSRPRQGKRRRLCLLREVRRWRRRSSRRAASRVPLVLDHCPLRLQVSVCPCFLPESAPLGRGLSARQSVPGWVTSIIPNL
jgi:hypothetical protein